MKYWILIFLVGPFCLFCGYPNLDNNPFITIDMQKMIAPHLLPVDHTAMPTLHEIFSQPHALQDEESLKALGFSLLSIRKKSAVVVARHSQLPGFIFKIYRDCDPRGRHNELGWESLVRRSVNAKKVKDLIKNQGLIYFKVPDKWLYVLPFTSDTPGTLHQPIILLATDMEIVTPEETRAAWKSRISPQHLSELYIVLKSGYGSTFLTGNIPFTKSGAFALLDLEKPKRKFNMKEVEPYLSKNMRHYWRSITD